MALLLKNGAIFLHLPKTGGSWVTEVLKDQGLIKYPIGHIHADLHQVLRLISPLATIKQELASQIKPHIPLSLKKKFVPEKKQKQAIWKGTVPDQDSTPFIFCFVRHPLTWYESIWRYMFKNDWPMFGRQYEVHKWHPKAMLNGLGDRNFNQFVTNIVNTRPGFVTEMYGWYTLPGVNFVGKQETLADDLITVLHSLELKFDEKRIRNFAPVNRSTDVARIPNPVWDPELRKIVLQIEHVALLRHDYLTTDK